VFGIVGGEDETLKWRLRLCWHLKRLVECFNLFYFSFSCVIKLYKSVGSMCVVISNA